MALTICNWKHDKRWVYSITYDEALIELHRFAVPIHEAYRIPGHVEAVPGHLGEVRTIGSSSYNGFRHMGGEDLKDLIARGWGVGNHSWSHEVIAPDMVDRELRRAKEVLEKEDVKLVVGIGPVPMMKFVCKMTEEYGVKTLVSLNSIMVDGTGMCGCCRVSIGGQTRFACVDGPDFDGHKVDFDELMQRLQAYLPEEAASQEKFECKCKAG